MTRSALATEPYEPYRVPGKHARAGDGALDAIWHLDR